MVVHKVIVNPMQTTTFLVDLIPLCNESSFNYLLKCDMKGGELTSKLKAVHSMFESGHIKLLVVRSFADDAAKLEAQEWAIDKGEISSQLYLKPTGQCIVRQKNG